jgi:hypothetical protein
MLWSLAVTFVAWLLALGYAFLGNRFAAAGITDQFLAGKPAQEGSRGMGICRTGPVHGGPLHHSLYGPLVIVVL